jgi:hypothetical protein
LFFPFLRVFNARTAGYAKKKPEATFRCTGHSTFGTDEGSFVCRAREKRRNAYPTVTEIAGSKLDAQRQIEFGKNTPVENVITHLFNRPDVWTRVLNHA